MNILFMDTSCRTLTVGAIFEGRVHSVVKDAGSGMSSMLMPAVVAVLSECGARVSDMDAVAAVVGPGSFTGIRIGAAAATALTMASGAKRIAVTNFELIAYGRGAVRAAVDAGRGNMYTAACEDGKALSAEFMTAEEFASAAADGAVFLTSPEKGTAAALLAVASEKAERGEFVPAFEPYYMRKPQAERGTE